MLGFGYFAFPPPGNQTLDLVRDELSNNSCQDGVEGFGQNDVDPAAASSASADVGGRPTQSKPASQEETDDARKRQRLEKEQKLALESEMEYVRMGFSIRDRFGRIDKARTEHVRAELNKRDAQAELIKQWETYETRWRSLLTSDTPVTFAQIPWPLPNLPSSIDDITPEAIIRFFLDSLKVPGNTASESDRLRSALLRWHPDKMSAVLSRTMDTELQPVREGVNIVFRALHARVNLVKRTQREDRA